MKNTRIALILCLCLSAPGAWGAEPPRTAPTEPVAGAAHTASTEPVTGTARTAPTEPVAGTARTASTEPVTGAARTASTEPLAGETQTARAEPIAGAAPNELAAGIAMVHAGEYGRAAPLLRKALETHPDDVVAAYYLGVALNRSTAGKEAESLLKRALMEDPEKPEVNFELALHYYDKKVSDEAEDYFEQVIHLAPASSYAGQARTYLRIIEARSKEKPWEIDVMAGLQYDSNVIVNGVGMPLPAGYSGKGDWNGLVYLRGSYTPVKTAKLEVAAGYTLYQSLHAELRDFDITQNQIDLSTAYSFTPHVKARGAYIFEHMLLGGTGYDTAHTLAPSLSATSEFWGTTTFDYRFRDTDYRNSKRFGTNSDRDGTNHIFGLSHLLPVSKSFAVLALYSRELERTRNEVWSYRGDRGLIGLHSVLPFDLTGDLSGEINGKEYRETDPSFGVLRRDTQYTASLSLTKKLSERFSLALGQTYTRNLSNIEFFQYRRSMTSVLVNARFK